MATQRPSVDVITGTIKANFPTRISFQVTSKIDSRTILGEQGAEQLLGKGDMLYMSSANRIIRIHAPFVSDDEIEKINNFLRSQAEPDYIDEILNYADEKEISDNQNQGDKDELYQSALEIIRSEGRASTSFLQRKLQIGYNRAARIIDMMENDGVVSKANHVGKRDVL
jgi:S-DNA-T family DNA segregation ATPase FtsK/SpoIIIE